MRRFVLALALLAALAAPLLVAAGPLAFPDGTTIRLVAPSNGISTATSLGEGDAGCYLVTVENERSCLCQNTTTCAETAAKDAVCLSPGASLHLRSRGPYSVAVISASGTGVVWLVPTDCR